jgi:serine protease inhibitor
MNKKLAQMNYYWGESFGAVSLNLKNGSSMWFILPDEGKSINDVLFQGEYLDLITSLKSEIENTKYMNVNLSVPKFNIQTSADLRPGLENMVITALFQPDKADFSAAFDTPAFITAANQAVRVEVDEQGVKASAYIELPGAGAAAPPEEIIDFILDRPFLFVIADNSGIPLFAGTVNQP